MKDDVEVKIEGTEKVLTYNKVEDTLCVDGR